MGSRADLILTMRLCFEQDVVLARQRARVLAACFKFDQLAQTRIATAVSEIVRNAYQNGADGVVEFWVVRPPQPQLQVTVRDSGPGITDLPAIMEGRYKSPTGMGIGIVGAKRLMDGFEITTAAGEGTTVVLSQSLPPRAVEAGLIPIRLLQDELAQSTPVSAFEEVRSWNEEQAQALTTLRQRESELARVNRELEDTNRSIIALYAQLDEKAFSLESTNRELEETNRGIVALYAELDEKASSLQRVSEVKTRFLSHVSHELRTPLNSILSMVEMLQDHSGKAWTGEQDKQLAFIRGAARELASMVDDLLDTAKVEAGKTEVKAETFDTADLFTSLRGMFNPLMEQNPGVDLHIDDPQDLPLMHSDQGKIAQILRNFIANALKFTKRGHVLVRSYLESPGWICFAVTDTGVGIAAEDQPRLFQEFSQIEGPHQRSIKGSGLGLALARKLSRLLGGDVSVVSTVGVGSTFVVLLPVEAPVAGSEDAPRSTAPLLASLHERLGEVANLSSQKTPASAPAPSPRPAESRAVIVDDNEMARYLLADLLVDEGYAVQEAVNGHDGLTLIEAVMPHVVFLDVIMPDLSGFEVLQRLRDRAATQRVPVIMHSTKALSDEENLFLKRMGAVNLPKGSTSRADALQRLNTALTMVCVEGARL